ncbi:MAG TPA: agmatine deiminase family protein [Ilumatobacteraceae bacterium]|nr:agmatine deiminase family protein [Ilumatobacteraceae bacterium]
MTRGSEAIPTDAGFAMPAEWEPHAACLMAWPSRSELWVDRLVDAQRDYAAVARAIAVYEPVVMVCNPGHAAEVHDLCGSGTMPIEIPINDSWSRDNGPAFVRNAAGEMALVGFGFNAWGNRWHPYDDDARLPGRLADRLALPFFQAPFVLEGGSFFVDGEGTAITTEQCLLNPNRNPQLSRAEIEQGLKDYLGASTVIWLPFGHSLDTGPAGTDGHVDGVLQYASPGRVLLEVVSDPTSPEFSRGRANLERLMVSRDAAGRQFEIVTLDPGPAATVSYANHYLANGAVIVPVGGDDADDPALATLRMLHPDREIVGVPGRTIAYGGGGPHCITQQIPEGVTIPG